MSISDNLTHGQHVGALYSDKTNMMLYDAQVGDTLHIGFWADENDHSSLEQAQNHLTDLFIEQLHARPGDRLLDAGCGLGAPALRVARATETHIVGISVAEKQIELALKKAAEQGLSKQVSFLHADMTNLPFESATFDHIYALESIMHVPGRISALREIYRVLKPGGRFVFSDVLAKVELSPLENQLMWEWWSEFVTLDSLMASVQAAGLTVLRALNMSSNVIPTFSLMRKNLQLHRDDLINKGLSEETLQQFGQGFDVFSKVQEEKVQHFLVTTQKPA